MAAAASCENMAWDAAPWIYWSNGRTNVTPSSLKSVEEPKPIKAPVTIQHHLPSVKELASIYRPLVAQLKQPFDLLQLFKISNKMDLPHPHLSIKYLREAGILVPQGDGTFTWDNQKPY